MANKASDSLYQLIKSLSKSEKRYFKLFVKRHTTKENNNNYEILFNAIDQMLVYQEEKLIQQLRGNSFINKFSIAKARLYETILKSLDSYYSEKSIDQKLRNEIHYIEILFKKSLYSQCAKRLNSAKKLATKKGKKLILTQIIEWEKRLIEKDNYITYSIDNLIKTIDEENSIIADIELENELWAVKSFLFKKVNQQGRVRSEEEAKELEKLVKPKLAKLHDKEGDPHTNYLIGHINSAYYFAIYDYSNSLNCIEKVIKKIKENKVHFEDKPHILFSELTNAIYLTNKLNENQKTNVFWNEINSMYKKLIAFSSSDLKIKFKSSIYSLWLTLHKDGKSYSNIGYDEIEEFLEVSNQELNKQRKAYLYLMFAVVCFNNRDYKKSLNWLNKLLNDIHIDEAQEIYGIAQLLALITHLELEHYDLVNYMLKSTKRFLKTRNKMHELEKVVILFIGKVIKIKSQVEFEDLRQKTIIRLDELLLNPYESGPIDYFNFYDWIKKFKIHQKQLR